MHDQPELSTQKFEMLKDADDKQDFESVGADGGETAQGNPATWQTKFHQVHTPKSKKSIFGPVSGYPFGSSLFSPFFTFFQLFFEKFFVFLCFF